jgi:membrane protein implicated in regulation of membrane protease activity
VVLSFFLVCFLVGLLLTVVSAFLGAADAGGAGIDLDLPDSVQPDGTYGKAAAVSPVNFQTAVAFTMCFGGAGYVLYGWGGAEAWLAAAGAAATGLGGAWLVWRFLQLLHRGETNMPVGSDSLIGHRGRLSLPIRPGGTGELIYTLHGVRQCCAARSHGAEPLAKGEAVVVVRYERGVAYVSPIPGRARKED